MSVRRPRALRASAPLRGALALAALGTVCGPGALGAAAAEPAPAISTDATRLIPGRPVTVSGTGWPVGAAVQTEVCGLDAVHGSADCDTVRGAVALVTTDGGFRVSLVVGAPPVDCPCVVRTTTGAGDTARTATIDVEVAGVSDGKVPVLEDVAPRVQIVDAELTGGPGPAELFGGRPHRTLVVTVRNTGNSALGRTPLIVRWGSGGIADVDAAAPATEPLPPGTTARYQVNVSMPLASFGRYSVGGRYAGETFLVTTDLYPWGLIAVAGGSALLTVFSIGWAVRRRLNRPPAPVPAPAPAAFPAPAAVPVTPEGLHALITSLALTDDTSGTPFPDPEVLGLEGLLRHLTNRPALIDRARLDALEALLTPWPAPPDAGAPTAAVPDPQAPVPGPATGAVSETGGPR
ncbi:hypothetical protein ACIPSE_10545 [Streptomyces sp. NPDC090106]|uniref:hypothetical protein n=1 Tax=Streptomyces sp. NPDC090106 TaxID=3365946 RepID=UPI0037F5AB92